MPDEQFVSALLNPDSPPPIGVIDPFGRAAPKRFNVYRNNVIVSLMSALETAFPAIRRILGAEQFAHMAAYFVRKYPPNTPMMMYYGGEMPNFLASQTDALPWLPEVAMIELALRESYHAADSTPLSPESLAQITAESRLIVAPALRLIYSAGPIVQLWRSGEITDEAPENALIVRPGFDPEVHSLTPEEASVMRGLLSGKTLAEALDEQADVDLTKLLSILVQSAAIVGITP